MLCQSADGMVKPDVDSACGVGQFVHLTNEIPLGIPDIVTEAADIERYRAEFRKLLRKPRPHLLDCHGGDPFTPLRPGMVEHNCLQESSRRDQVHSIEAAVRYEDSRRILRLFQLHRASDSREATAEGNHKPISGALLAEIAAELF
jgi:hypothetical protein